MRRKLFKNGATAPKEPISGNFSYWQFENNGLDSVRSNHLTFTGTANYTNGLVGTAVSGTQAHTDGVSEFALSGTKPFSMLCAFNTPSFPTSGKEYKLMMFQEGTSISTFDKGFKIYPDGRIGFYAFDGAVKNANSPMGSVSLDTWHVAIGIFDGATLYIYLDDVLLGSAPCSGTYAFTTPRLMFNHIGGATGLSYNGLFDESALFDKVLTSEEITRITNDLKSGQHFI